jgi:hypothetical protein
VSLAAGSASRFLTQSPNADIYRWALAAVERRNYRIYDPSYALANDPFVYDRMLQVPVVKHGVMQRAAMVAGREWSCVPGDASPEAAQKARLANDWLRLIDRFDSARNRLAQAFFYGSTYEEMRGDFERVRLASDDRPRRWYVVRDMKNVDKRRFTRWRSFRDGTAQDQPLDATPASEWVMSDIVTNQWQRVDEPERFVKHVYDDREQFLGYGSGLVDALYWSVFALGIAEREGLGGLERWAQGWVTAKVGAERAGKKGRDNDSIVDEWVSVLEAQRSRHVLVYGEGDEVNVIEPTGAGHQIVVDYCNMLKTDITRLCLGAQRPSGGGGESQTGARAQAETEATTTESVIQFDQSQIDDTVSHDVIGYWVYMNTPILREMGLDEAADPKFVSLKQKVEDPLKNAQVIETALRAGVPLPEEWVYERIGAPRPKPGERVIEPRAVPAMQPGAFAA